MDWRQWTRDASKVHKALEETPDAQVVAKKDVYLYIPERFIEKQLAEISAETYILGIFAIRVGETFGVSTVNAMMRITPTTISTVKFDDESYLEFYFAPGSVVIADTSLIKQDTLVYKIFDEIIAKGNVPWYLNYEDLAKLFNTADEYAGFKAGSNHSILEMFAAAIARDPDDRNKYYRHTVASTDELQSRPPVLIPLRSIVYGPTNTPAKLMGSYFSDGLTSALVSPSTKTERIEDLLRR